MKNYIKLFVFLVLVIVAIILYVTWLFDAKSNCANGDMSACVEYNWLLTGSRR